MKMNFTFSDSELNIIEGSIKAEKEYDNDNFYAATDGYRWGHPDPKLIQSFEKQLELIIKYKLIQKGFSEDLAEELVAAMNCRALCKPYVSKKEKKSEDNELSNEKREGE